MIKNAEDGDKQFLHYIVTAIVDNPNEVSIERTIDEMGVLLLLSVHRDDMGKVIGRQGNTARAIRTLLKVVGLKNNARVNLKIKEPKEAPQIGAQKKDDSAEDAS